MTLSLAAACVWLVIANLLAMLPSRDNYWTRAYALITVGVPVLGWVFWENGPWVALLFMAAGGWILRWPLVYLTRWILRRLGCL